MLIPEKKDGVTKWRWNAGPLCDSQEEALKTAQVPATAQDERVFVMDTHEALEVEGDQ